jgi:hypothetical protein
MLLTSQRLGEIETQLPDTGEADTDNVEALRQILIKQERREVGYSEAQEIGASLIEFYQILAEEASDDSES